MEPSSNDTRKAKAIVRNVVQQMGLLACAPSAPNTLLESEYVGESDHRTAIVRNLA